jgi:hypothetical protein
MKYIFSIILGIVILSIFLILKNNYTISTLSNENFESRHSVAIPNNNIWNAKYPNYLTRLYKPIYTYVFYDAYNRDILVNRTFRIGFYSLDGTISNIYTDLRIESIKNNYNYNRTLKESINKNQYYSIDNRVPLKGEKADNQYKLFNGTDTSIADEWKWFFDQQYQYLIKDFYNWIYYCNSFSNYFTRNLYNLNVHMYTNYDDMFNDFLKGELDFFISPFCNRIKYDLNNSFLYKPVIQLGYITPKIFNINNTDVSEGFNNQQSCLLTNEKENHNSKIKNSYNLPIYNQKIKKPKITKSKYKINIYNNKSFYHEYFTRFYKSDINTQYTYYNELECFDKYVNNSSDLNEFGIMKLTNTPYNQSVPFHIYTHSTQSEHCIQKKLYKQLKNMFENQKQNYLNLINQNLNNY